jgi:hypothetical protein
MQKSQARELASEIHTLLKEHLRKSAPNAEAIESVIADYIEREATMLEHRKTAALLKPSDKMSNSRVRELAGIPHKRNFV